MNGQHSIQQSNLKNLITATDEMLEKVGLENSPSPFYFKAAHFYIRKIAHYIVETNIII